MRYALNMPQIRNVMTRTRRLACGVAILVSGCTVSPAPPGGSEPTPIVPPIATTSPSRDPGGTPQPEPDARQQAEPSVAASAPTVSSAAPTPDNIKPSAPTADDKKPSAPPDSTKPSAPAGDRAVPLVHDKSVPSVPPAGPSAAKPPATAPQKPAGPPPLDLKSLETRLKETKAIGVYTKLTLKNQVDDLLDEFRAYYKGQLKTTLAELRRAFDLLVLKVLALLQDADPQLASAIAASREAIWGILSDPVKFATV